MGYSEKIINGFQIGLVDGQYPEVIRAIQSESSDDQAYGVVGRATPDPRRTRIDDDLKQQLLDHGMNMYQQHGGDMNGIVMTLGALISRHDKMSERGKRVVHEYLGGQFVRDLEDKLDAYDQNNL